jgi:hypothetical protein
MRALLALLLLGALAAPAAQACDHGYGYRYYRSGYHRPYRHARPYWHHPYYARFGYQRPYLYYRQLRTFGYAAWYGDCGFGYYTYYSPYVAVAPVYSRLGVALTLSDPVFAGDPDGLPRSRTGPVGSRFLKDIG